MLKVFPNTVAEPVRSRRAGPTVSVVVPVFNEVDNLPLLHRALSATMCSEGWDYEVVYVNDGSTDGSTELLDSIASNDRRTTVVHLRRNFGQTAAISAGLDEADGEIVATIDADLQNDPSDLPGMIRELNTGYDVVVGWREHRQDSFWSRRLPSRAANFLIRRITGVQVRDLGCTLRVMRRHIAQDLSLYGDMHRFIPILAHWHGASILEVPTRHHARRFGQTKYGLSRTFRVLLDLVTIKYLIQYSNAPMRFFGTFGMGCGVGAIALATAVFGMKWWGVDMTGNPLLYVSLFGIILSLQFFSLGILGEMSSRTYYESQGRRPYAVRRRTRSSSPEHRSKAA